MEKSCRKITCGDFNALRQAVALTGIAGEWTKGNNHHQFRTANGTVLNYWKTTGRINFQGPEFAAAELKARVLQRAIVIEVPVNRGQDDRVIRPPRLLPGRWEGKWIFRSARHKAGQPSSAPT
jgi:hypothetical protein